MTLILSTDDSTIQKFEFNIKFLSASSKNNWVGRLEFLFPYFDLIPQLTFYLFLSRNLILGVQVCMEVCLSIQFFFINTNQTHAPN